MEWEIKNRGRVTYFRKKTNDVFSDLVVEELDNGDLKIRFVGMTGAIAASNELGLDNIARMRPEQEIPRIFDTWEMYLREAGICKSLAEVDFLEVHSFGAVTTAHSWKRVFGLHTTTCANENGPGTGLMPRDQSRTSCHPPASFISAALACLAS